jgi:hypothetical protein
LQILAIARAPARYARPDFGINPAACNISLSLKFPSSLVLTPMRSRHSPKTFNTKDDAFNKHHFK